MDKEEARFILRSFRPDGADVGDADFAGALQLAIEDRELGEWLADERATDAAFAKALGSVALPPHLREDILACLSGGGGYPQVSGEIDAAMVGALSSVQPPPGLRAEILTAMERTRGTTRRSPFRRFAIPLAAAAGIALALLVTRPSAPVARLRPDHSPASTAVAIETVRDSFVRTLNSPTFALEERQANPQVLVSHLRTRKLPCPGGLPAGLRKYKAHGCRELVVDGKRGSLICFNLGADGSAHLIVFRREDVLGEIPRKEEAQVIRSGDWSSARWTDGRKVYLVMSHVPPERLRELL